MSDPNDWIKERRRIHDAATEGPWKARPGDEIEGPGGDNLMGGDMEYFSGFMLRGENATAVADAHNMFPRALDALEAVLELHSMSPNVRRYGIPRADKSEHYCMADREAWPCSTVRTIEGVIDEQ